MSNEEFLKGMGTNGPAFPFSPAFLHAAGCNRNVFTNPVSSSDQVTQSWPMRQSVVPAKSFPSNTKAECCQEKSPSSAFPVLSAQSMCRRPGACQPSFDLEDRGRQAQDCGAEIGCHCPSPESQAHPLGACYKKHPLPHYHGVPLVT